MTGTKTTLAEGEQEPGDAGLSSGHLTLQRLLERTSWTGAVLLIRQFSLAQNRKSAKCNLRNAFLCANNAGWTAVHVAANVAPGWGDQAQWTSDSNRNDANAPPLWLWKWLLRQVLRMEAEEESGKQRGGLRRFTERGLTPTDVFFEKWLYPARPSVNVENEPSSEGGLVEAIHRVVSSSLSQDPSILLAFRRAVDRAHDRSAQEEKRQKDEMGGSASSLGPDAATLSGWRQPQRQIEETYLDDDDDDDWMVSPLLLEFWVRMEILVLATHYQTLDFLAANGNQRARQFRIVHALAHTGCPRDVFQLAVLLYREQVTEPDEATGMLPIHIATSLLASPSVVALGGSTCWDGEVQNTGNEAGANRDSSTQEANAENNTDDDNDGDGDDDNDDAVDEINNNEINVDNADATQGIDPIAHAAIGTRRQPPAVRKGTGPWHGGGEPLDFLVTSFPETVTVPDAKGRIPLFSALDSEKGAALTWTTGIRSLLRAHPDAILAGVCDSETGLPPFALAAVLGADDSDRAKRLAATSVGGTWYFLPLVGKQRALKTSRRQVDLERLSTSFELLRMNPGQVNY